MYNNSNNDGVYNLEIIAALISCDSLDKVFKMLESELFTLDEKKKLINSIKEIINDKEIEVAIKFEDNIEYCFEVAREKPYGDCLKVGIEQTLKDSIINMLKEIIDKNIISKVTRKDIDYITKLSKEIQ